MLEASAEMAICQIMKKKKLFCFYSVITQSIKLILEVMFRNK